LIANNFEEVEEDDTKMYEQYNKLKKYVSKSQNILLSIVNYIEKLKNLFEWRDSNRTFIILVILYMAYGLLSKIPFSVLLILGGKN
jgi:fatty-acid desaturase